MAELRRRRAEVDRALERFRLLVWRDPPPRGAAERSELARLAEAAGRIAEARALFAWALAADPGHAPARDALVRLDRMESDRRRELRMELGPWPSVVAERPARMNQAVGPGDRVSFTDDAEAAGLRFVYDSAETPLHHAPEPFGGGVAVLDYDGDGWLDVYCPQGGPFSADPGCGGSLFRNKGDGTFVNATTAAGLDRLPRGHGFGVAVGDYDNDGDPDLFVTRWRSYALYRNRGDGTFEDATEAAGLSGDRDWPSSAAFADLDGDGDLDLYVGHYWGLGLRQSAHLPRLEHPRLPQLRPARHPAAARPPVPQRRRPVRRRLGRGGGHRGRRRRPRPGRGGRRPGRRRQDRTSSSPTTRRPTSCSSTGAVFASTRSPTRPGWQPTRAAATRRAWAWRAATSTATAASTWQSPTSTASRPPTSATSAAASFTDATAAVGLTAATRQRLGFGVAFLDADRDGRLDLATANGHVNDLRPNFPYRMPAQLLLGAPGRPHGRRHGPGRCPLGHPAHGRGLAVADLDNDGRQDVLIVSQDQPMAYLHNRTDGGHWLTLRLEGRDSNRDAVGAKVAVIAGGRRLVAQRVGGGSYLSSSDPRLHFGLGASTRIDAIEVRWPSGAVGRYTDLAADTAYSLREGKLHPVPLRGWRRSPVP